MKKPGGRIYTKPWLILCEGSGDKAFFERLIEHYDINKEKFDVYFPNSETDPTGGRAKFGPWLANALEFSETFRENVKVVLFVSDNDDDMQKSFSEVTASLAKVHGITVPKTERSLAKAKAGNPDLMILMIPLDECGNIETICVRAAYTKWPIKDPLDSYVAATDASAWGIGRQSKMRMHSILAATCASKPDVTFAHHWQQPSDFHIPIGDPAFEGIVNFLKDFETKLAA